MHICSSLIITKLKCQNDFVISAILLQKFLTHTAKSANKVQKFWSIRKMALKPGVVGMRQTRYETVQSSTKKFTLSTPCNLPPCITTFMIAASCSNAMVCHFCFVHDLFTLLQNWRKATPTDRGKSKKMFIMNEQQAAHNQAGLHHWTAHYNARYAQQYNWDAVFSKPTAWLPSIVESDGNSVIAWKF